MEYIIPFNKPYIQGPELDYIKAAVASGKISGDGLFTKKCQEFFESRYNFQKCLMTTSCTDALEMAALLLNIKPGDEVIVPSYTFVSSANAFALRGAKIIFADSQISNPNICSDSVASLITPKTKAIVAVHYAGVACDMSELLRISEYHGINLIEDAAQAVDSFYLDRPLGGIGTLGAFSFHETKNIICGEGGLLIINDSLLQNRAEIIREKGTNRASFFRGEVDKYSWVDIGSSFLPSDIISAYLYAQLENLDVIQQRRKDIWKKYDESLKEIGKQTGLFVTPYIPEYSTNNAHMYYLVCKDLRTRTELISFLKERKVYAAFHYQSLHSSTYFAPLHDGRTLTNADRYSDCIVRLPLYYELTNENVMAIIEYISDFSKLHYS